ncbi:EspA/EspE family type VII secretion system effector [Mycobacterium marinum]|uniref:EspA/EspE family type VII secretion system effector n=1 Tax=Mycobacterium marinum TaxID=1781 RepID=UPI002359FFA4|nr:EspA/EspE family type VII secretion system effector [Mycobacterium marinum]MDC8985523.1 EspA/EspE family type VII secretion system effector [Mycobacterium marinum]MDC9002833.1 EspA/EspE family type VII secretion system effector [Mycobacterium marinum]MDC9013560.1 EspA/EspE family type VII secretion system effector [Mycobacterium marinum]MDC9018910.1 EspA/EspE family type VII secretion system effector [Mycobacterium marinum]
MTESILGAMLGLLGDGGPEKGDRLKGSGSTFDDLAVRVATLDPRGGWRGGAAHAYGARTRAQSQHATLMADLDRLAAELVSAQAHAVNRSRDLVTGEMVAVASLLPVCIVLELMPTGQELSFVFAAVPCAIAVAGAVIGVIALECTTSQNSSNLRTATRRSTDMAAALSNSSPTTPGASDADSALAKGVSRFAVADHTAPSPSTVELGSALAALPGAPQFHLATDAGAGFADFGAPGLPIPPLTGMPTLPDASGLPTIASLSTTLGQLSGLAGPTNAASQLANTATQHAQTIATMAQQHSSRAGHPTPDHGTDNPDTEGAAAATTTGHRAPIDTQTRPTQQHSVLPG